MPYATNADLPDPVRNNLPDAAQTIYRKAFNAALEDEPDEARAIRIAWAAVKNVYEKSDEKWVKKDAVFEPPESGDLPAAGKEILANAYSACRQRWVEEHPDDKENQANKESCAKQAWTAVKNVYEKSDEKWVKKDSYQDAQSAVNAAYARIGALRS